MTDENKQVTSDLDKIDYSFCDIASYNWKNNTLYIHLSDGRIVQYKNVNYAEYLSFSKNFELEKVISNFEDISNRENLYH